MIKIQDTIYKMTEEWNCSNKAIKRELLISSEIATSIQNWIVNLGPRPEKGIWKMRPHNTVRGIFCLEIVPGQF